jgi:hypothetical protein
MFKLTEEYVLMGGCINKILVMSTFTNKIVQTLTLEPQEDGEI